MSVESDELDVTSEPNESEVHEIYSNGEAVTDAESLLVGPDSSVTPIISVVMPTMNEEEGIGECIRRAKRALAEVGVPGEIIISDDSTDRTPEIARDLGAIVVNPDGKGYGYAYRYAFEKARGEYLVMGDADTTYDFEQIPRLLEPVRKGEADMVMGSRLEGEIREGSMPTLHQHVGNPLLTKFLNVFYGAGVSDAHSGFRVFSRDALETMDLETTGMEFASEMIMEAGARDLEIHETPIVYHEREGEETLDSFRDGWRHVRFMLLNAPGYLFSIPGLVLMGLGVLLMGLVSLGGDFGSMTLGVRTQMAGSLFAITGLQIASFGVFASVAGDPISQPRDPVTEYVGTRMSLETGATLGLAVFALGVGYAAWMVTQWTGSGFADVPSVGTSLVAFTAIVVGMQTVFGSFFIGAISD
jgi:hypothetical protein